MCPASLTAPHPPQVRIWDLARQRCLRTLQAHEGYIRAMTHTNDGASFLTVGDDKTVKRWRAGELDEGEEEEPENTILLRVSVMDDGGVGLESWARRLVGS